MPFRNEKETTDLCFLHIEYLSLRASNQVGWVISKMNMRFAFSRLEVLGSKRGGIKAKCLTSVWKVLEGIASAQSSSQ
jgi:hypothetical protein